MKMSGHTRTCSAGESFDGIALEVYGDERYAAELMMANPALSVKARFSGGEILKLPVIEVQAMQEGMPVNAPWKE